MELVSLIHYVDKMQESALSYLHTLWLKLSQLSQKWYLIRFKIFAIFEEELHKYYSVDPLCPQLIFRKCAGDICSKFLSLERKNIFEKLSD